MERDNDDYGRATAWFLLGGVVGASIALLFAPESGRKIRARVGGTLRDAGKSVVDAADDVADTTRDLVERAESIGDKAIGVIRDASQAASDLVDSLGGQTKRK